SIVVPSYRRPGSLERCLDAIRAQQAALDEVIVVHRADDDQTIALLGARGDVRAVAVRARGVLAAMAAGAGVARHDLIGFLDDDVRPRPDWWRRIAAHFEDPIVGGAGGRDHQANATQRPSRRSATTDVGGVTRWGRLVGNHHLGEGEPRCVDVLKGANMVFRRASLALPVGLRGAGAEAHFEVATSLWARARGWTLIYD